VLFGGTYDVFVDMVAVDVSPKMRTMVERARVLPAAAHEDYDVATVSITGELTLGGATMPDGAARGALFFYNVLGNRSFSTTLPSTGPATYQVKLFAGNFEVSGSGDDRGPIPMQGFPLVRGCVDAFACAASSGDVGGSWAIDGYTGYAATLWLLQSGATLNGSFTDSTYVADQPIGPSTRSGDAVTIRYRPSCRYALHGALANGCLMSGYLSDCGNTNMYWIGFRTN
jgi:hypothetical protein